MVTTNRRVSIAPQPNEQVIAQSGLAQYIQNQADGIAPELPTSVFKAFVPCEIQAIERIGVSKRGSTPYLVYRTKFGKCCTFLSKAGFLQALSTLLGIKEQQPVVAIAYQLGDFGGVKVTSNSGDRYITRAELFSFLIRLNRVGLDGLQVRLQFDGAIVQNPQKGTTYRISVSGCGCNDILYRHSSCKHQIAAYIYLKAEGWGSLNQYIERDLGSLPNDKVFALAAIAKADLGL